MWAEWLFAHRRATILVVCVAVVFAASGLSKLTFTPDTRVFFDEADPRAVALRRFEETFLPSHTILFAMQSDELFTESVRVREALKWLDERVRETTNVRSVDSMASVSHAYSENGELVVEPYLDYLCPSACFADRRSVANDPIVLRRLISEDASVLGVAGTYNLDRKEASKIARINDEATQIKKEFTEKFPSMRIYVTGGIPMSQAFVDAGQRDSTLNFAFSATLILVLLVLFLGGVRNASIMLATGFGAVVIAMGMGGWLGVELNSASAAAPIVILTLVVASTMHLFTHYLRLCEDPRGPAFAATTALTVNLAPILLTCLTSVVSLGSLLFVSSPPVRDIGLLSTIGVLCGSALAVTLTPLLLDTAKRSRDSSLNRVLQERLNRYTASIDRGQAREWIVLAVVLASIGGLTQLKIDEDFVEYFSERTDFKHDTDFIMHHLVGPNHIEVQVKAKEGTVFDPIILSEIDALASMLRQEDFVASAVSLADIQRSLLHAFDIEAEVDAVPASGHSQLFHFAYEMALDHSGTTRDLISSDHTQTHLPVFLGAGSAQKIQELEKLIYLWTADSQRIDVVVTGENIPVAHLSSSNIPSVAKAIATSLLFTAVLLGFFFRSWKISLIALAAITLPVLAGFGIWGWVVDSIGLAGTIVIAISIGVVIDDAIHLIYQQRRALGFGQSPRESTRTSVHRVGVPIIATTFVFVVGLSPLLYSDFGLNITLAACTGVILLMSLKFDLGLLPSLLSLVGREKSRAKL